MNHVHLVALLAVLEFLLFIVLVGRARIKYKIKAPATSGHPQFERALRVQMNTMEQLMLFLPVLWIAGLYWSQAVIAGIGAVWLLGRLIYRHQYVNNPDGRAPGFMLTILPTVVLLVAALAGVVRSGLA